MTTITTLATYEKGLLRPLRPLNLTEHQQVAITIKPAWPAEWDEKRRALAEVLGFDPEDEAQAESLAESQYRAMQDLIGMFSSDAIKSTDDLDAILYDGD